MNRPGMCTRRLAARAGLLAATGAAVVAAVPHACAILAQERPPEASGEPSPESTVLMLWGGVRADGEVVLEPAFAYEGSVRGPGAPGDYRVRGLDGEGETLFSISFTPGEISDGSKGFSYSIPFDAAWTEALDRLEFSAPEGVTTVDREAGARAMMVIDRATGQVRSILRRGPVPLPPELAADSSRVRILRGLPRPLLRPPPRPPG
ncbi:hypothetical protein [Candidatus Palauibacter sp.]|uniref:hypothetical protein n=1 Tax=Candidatus Palauibacter sp. TaxID=3101350 RepID=UPI003B52C6D6